MELIERFLKYVSFETSSSEESETSPSSEKELVLGRYLAEELKEIGLENARIDEYGYVYGELPASKGCENATKLGFISHMDVSPSVSGKDIKPRRFKYEGGDIKLNEGIYTRVKDFPFLEDMKGQELIVTDGTTLLGADDKAGVAEIFTAMEYLIDHPEIKHGKISVSITPDEEVGRGTEHFDLEHFDADYGYTVDGGLLGEIEYECFNAAQVDMFIHGFNIHPGSAKGKMKNAVLVANDIMSAFPEFETPAHTEGYEGFYHFQDIAGDESFTKIHMLVRDHDRTKFEARKEFVKSVVEKVNNKWGEGTVKLKMEDNYYNMREKIEPCMFLIDNAKKAFENNGVTPKISAIRGGTDGARLSYEGLPCPNLSTGGANFHGINELVSVDAMKTMVKVIVDLVTIK